MSIDQNDRIPRRCSWKQDVDKALSHSFMLCIGAVRTLGRHIRDLKMMKAKKQAGHWKTAMWRIFCGKRPPKNCPELYSSLCTVLEGRMPPLYGVMNHIRHGGQKVSCKAPGKFSAINPSLEVAGVRVILSPGLGWRDRKHLILSYLMRGQFGVAD